MSAEFENSKLQLEQKILKEVTITSEVILVETVYMVALEMMYFSVMKVKIYWSGVQQMTKSMEVMMPIKFLETMIIFQL